MRSNSLVSCDFNILVKDIKEFCAKAVHEHSLNLTRVMWKAAIDSTPGEGEGRWSSNLVNSWNVSKGKPVYKDAGIRRMLESQDVPLGSYPNYQVEPFLKLNAVSSIGKNRYANIYITNGAKEAFDKNYGVVYAADINNATGVYEGKEPRHMVENALAAGVRFRGNY